MSDGTMDDVAMDDAATSDPAVNPRTSDAGLDTARVSDWLAAETELRAPLTYTRIGNGQSNLTYRVEDAGGRRAILRRPPLGAVLESAHDMAREYRILTGLHGQSAPVPATLGLCEDTEVTGAPFYVMELVDGTVLFTDTDALALSESARRTAGLELGRTLARLQAVDLEAAGLGDLKRRTPYAARQLRRWRGQWEASRTRELPAVEELADRFEAAMPAEEERVLVHGDFRLDNLVVRDDGTVAAVLDWELCSAGHPLADVGLAVAYWREAGIDDGLFGYPITSLAGFPSVDELIDSYATASGRDVTAVPYFVAFAYWKVAIIVEGVHRRWLSNPVNGAETASRVGLGVPGLVQRADEAARAAGF
jgi:aminoglycoside phosphotransferase (APT) family kinase protein